LITVLNFDQVRLHTTRLALCDTDMRHFSVLRVACEAQIL
jgi:hypothetical protein